MFAVDDGLTSGNFNVADVFFLIGAILGVIAAVLSIPRTTATPAHAWSSVAGWLAAGFIAFGLFLL
jgi:hypothetical protein